MHATFDPVGGNVIRTREEGQTLVSGRVLIVHTAVVMRMIVKEQVTASGYEVVGEALNGFQCLEQYRALRPDIVTMDMILPEMDGVAAIKAIIAEFPQALIIICTSVGQPELLAQALQAGAKAFVVKPFAAPKLADAIRRLLAA